jgi:hypothetical protein
MERRNGANRAGKPASSSIGRAIGGIVAAGAMMFLATSALAAVDMSGVWEMRFREYIKLDDGSLPPMRPVPLAAYNERVEALKAGKQMPDSALACLPHGTPRLMYTPYPVHILQRPEVVAFLFEVNHNIRLAYIGQELPKDPDPTYLGSSVARWDGDTLVIDTIGLNDKIQVDRAGLPQSTATKINERLTMIDNGQKMRVVITVTDDTLYTKPWSFTVEWKKADYNIMEYVCENNRER